MRVGAIILAAGASKRLGQPKQMLVFHGKTLLKHAIDSAFEAGCDPVIVVTNPILAVTDELLRQLMVVVNEAYETGMASSVVEGVKMLTGEARVADAVIIMVCDQPFANAAQLEKLEAAFKTTGKKIVASAYRGTAGVPVLFASEYFGELLDLTGDQGAKKILQQHAKDVENVAFDSGAVDIDTINDYNRLLGIHG